MRRLNKLANIKPLYNTPVGAPFPYSTDRPIKNNTC